LAHQTLAVCAALHVSAMTFHSSGINLFWNFLMLWVTCHALKAMYKLNLDRWALLNFVLYFVSGLVFSRTDERTCSTLMY